MAACPCRLPSLSRRPASASAARLIRGPGLDVVWQPFVVLFAIGAALFGYALARFRATTGMMI